MGLKVPDTIVTNSKEELVKFKKKHREIITKPIYEVLKLKDDFSNIYTNRTELVDNKVIRGAPDAFFSSLFQENIKKKLK